MTNNKMLYQAAFIKKLEQLGVAWRVGNNCLCFLWQGLTCNLLYTANNSVELCALHLASFSKAQLPEAYALCSRLNNEINWLKLIINKQNELECRVMSAVNADDVVAETLELLERMLQVAAIVSRHLDVKRGEV